MTPPQWIRRTWARWVARHQARRAPVRRAWTAAGEGAGVEARAGALLRQAIVREPMSDTQLAAVKPVTYTYGKRNWGFPFAQ